MNRSDIAIAKFEGGFNCAQSVFYAFCDDLNFDKNFALKLACGFGAGMARNEEVCGAVSGGIMVLGMKYGRGESGDRTHTEQTYRNTRKLMDAFAEKHGTFICRRLLEGCELTTSEGQKEFKEKDLISKVCKLCVTSAVIIIQKIIDEDQSRLT